MRFVRRASLVFSLTLIVAIAVGYVARHNQLSSERDHQLTAAAELGANRLTSLVDSIEVAAATGTDPADTARAVGALHSQLGVCAVSVVTVVCAGDGPEPPAQVVDDQSTARREGDVRRPAFGTLPQAAITVYEQQMTIDVDGSDLSLIVQTPTDIVGSRSDVALWATTFVPEGASIGGFAVDQDVRQTATSVDAAAGVFVVAAGDAGIQLPADEQRFYVIIFTLAVILLLLAGVTIVVEQRNLLERASFDPLTKLPNRGEFERRSAEALAVAERQGTGACLLLFDLNGFKKINDTYGHHAGDEMLKVVGSRLRKAVRDGDIVARWGGDEFVVVMPGIADDEMGTRRARQLADQVSGRTRLEGVDEPLRVKVSVGVSLAPRHGFDTTTLVEAADQAMYEAKREGLPCRVASTVAPLESTAAAPVPAATA